MFFVIFHLDFPAAHGFPDGVFHGRCYRIGIHNDLALCVSSGTANGLNQRAFAAQESLFVCVQNGHQRHLGNIKSFPQQVNTDQHVKFTQTQIADNLHALHGIHIVMHVPHTDAHIVEKVCQILSHFLGQGCY